MELVCHDGPQSVRALQLRRVKYSRARVDPAESEHAQRTIAANYGLGRRLYESISAGMGVSIVYVEA
jgi:hypothetical protein